MTSRLRSTLSSPIAARRQHLGAQIGATLVPHTWGSALTRHPHVNGILSPDGERWITCHPGFSLPVRVLSRPFRRRFLEALADAHQRGQLQFFGEYTELANAATFARWRAPLRTYERVVYANRLFAGPETVIEYLSRYTHRVTTSNQCLFAFDERGVAFRWKNYRAKGRSRYKTMTLETGESICRFLLHVLPGGFHRIHHYWVLANPVRSASLANVLHLLHVALEVSPPPDDTGLQTLPFFVCRHCGTPMIVIDILARNAPIRAPPMRRSYT